jgi:hypothetical protein
MAERIGEPTGRQLVREPVAMKTDMPVIQTK